MATRSTAVPSPSRTRRVARAGRGAQRRRFHFVVYGVVALVVIAAAAIALLAGNGASSSQRVPSGIEQTRPVRVTGEPLPAFGDAAADPAVGVVAPQLRGAAFDGKPVTVAPTGRPQLLLFTAHWCPHCNREMPILGNWLRSGGLPAGVDMTTIATGTNRNLPNYPPSSWIDRFGWTTAVMADSSNGAAAHALGLPGYPFFVVLDGNGRVAARASGELTMPQLEALIAKANAN